MARSSNKSVPRSRVRLASYGKTKVYKSYRIKLDANLLNTLCIRPGDSVEVFLDTEERAIVIRTPGERDSASAK